MKVLKDPDINRAIGFGLHFIRSNTPTFLLLSRCSLPSSSPTNKLPISFFVSINNMMGAAGALTELDPELTKKLIGSLLVGLEEGNVIRLLTLSPYLLRNEAQTR
jgi:hypothetical protein